MALKLCKHKGIREIRVVGTEILLSQFADDTDIYLPFQL